MNASCSMFSQILKLVPRIEFELLVNETGSEYAAKGLSSWSTFLAMMFRQLGQPHSLREIDAPAKTSLSYANVDRPGQVVARVFHRHFERGSGSARAPRNLRLDHKLVILDSTLNDTIRQEARIG